MPKSSSENFRPCDLRYRHLGDDLFDIVQQDALGELQLEVLRIGAGAVERRQNLINEAGLAELAGADIHGEGDMGGIRPVSTSRNLGEGFSSTQSPKGMIRPVSSER